jgi:hypothetical protein
MSDTFGASDLNADMPGLGPQPGNVRGEPQQLPSALQGLVKHFFQTSQGNPNPKFLPPPPGQGGGQKKPQLGSTDPPDRSARAMAPVPANAPQPPSSFSPYTRPLPRDDSQWGQPEPFPRLPQSFELHGIYQGSGNYFAQHGAYASAPVAANLAGQTKEYQDGFMKGQDWKMKMAQEQVRLSAAKLEDLERTRSMLYADVFARHRAEGDNDPTAVHDDLWKVAVEHGDQDVIRMLEHGDSAEKVRRFLAEHEANIRALGAANKKSDEQEAVEAQAGLAPARDEGGGGSGGVYDRYAPGTTGGAAPAAGQVAGPGAPSGDKDVRTPGVGDPADKDKPDDPSDTRSEGQKLIDRGAWDMVEGFKPDGGQYSKATQTKMAIGKLRMENALKDIAANPNINRDGKHPEEVLDAVRKAVPDAAGLLDQYAKYEAGPGVAGRSSSGGPEAPMWALFNPLAEKMYPGDRETGAGQFNPDNLQAIHQFRDPNGQTQKQIQRIGPTVEAAEQLVAAINKLPPEDRQNLSMDAIKAKMLGGDPTYRAIWANWLNYNQDVNALSVPGGSVTETLLSENQVPWYSSSAEYLSVIREHIGVASSRVDEFHNTWKQLNPHQPMPGENRGAEAEIPRLKRLDLATGMLPGDRRKAKDGKTYEYTGKDMDDPNADANWKVVRASP